MQLSLSGGYVFSLRQARVILSIETTWLDMKGGIHRYRQFLFHFFTLCIAEVGSQWHLRNLTTTLDIILTFCILSVRQFFDVKTLQKVCVDDYV